jgi:hypothetical protein
VLIKILLGCLFKKLDLTEFETEKSDCRFGTFRLVGSGAIYLFYFIFIFFVSSLLCGRAPPHGTQYIQTGMGNGKVLLRRSIKSTPVQRATRAAQCHTPPLTRHQSIERAGVSATVLGHAPLLHPEKSKTAEIGYGL